MSARLFFVCVCSLRDMVGEAHPTSEMPAGLLGAREQMSRSTL
jgi:hypothetical protein